MRDLAPARRLRASDQERHESVMALSEHYASGRLDHDEFERRMAAASEATYLSELDPLFDDLPAPGARTAARAHEQLWDHRPAYQREARDRAGRGGVGPWLLLRLLVLIALVAAVVTSRGHLLWILLPVGWWVMAITHRRPHHPGQNP